MACWQFDIQLTSFRVSTVSSTHEGHWTNGRVAAHGSNDRKLQSRRVCFMFSCVVTVTNATHKITYKTNGDKITESALKTEFYMVRSRLPYAAHVYVRQTRIALE